mmetsp:Transcript_101367/g.322007  ORF Transcript_101367/g.322007 Transcript_101367/m.322007 type:complete len:254 (+) Transcript_101367:93-854(+)
MEEDRSCGEPVSTEGARGGDCCVRRRLRGRWRPLGSRAQSSASSVRGWTGLCERAALRPGAGMALSSRGRPKLRFSPSADHSSQDMRHWSQSHCLESSERVFVSPSLCKRATPSSSFSTRRNMVCSIWSILPVVASAFSTRLVNPRSRLSIREVAAFALEAISFRSALNFDSSVSTSMPLASSGTGFVGKLDLPACFASLSRTRRSSSCNPGTSSSWRVRAASSSARNRSSNVVAAWSLCWRSDSRAEANAST